jgi:hypothetical protein
VGILAVPVLRALSQSPAMLNAENFVAVGYVYWILLDPIQGAYDLFGASVEAVRYALVAVGISAAAMWAGTVARPWTIPSALLTVVAKPLDTAQLRWILLICFALGMSKFVYSVQFDLVEMFSYLGQDRWAAPWSRGALGGWDSFLDHTQYFGYVLPAIATLLVVRKGWLKLDSLLALALATVMVLFLAQGGGRRIIGVTVGAAIIVWILAQPGMKMSKLLGAIAGVFGLLLGMQFVLEIRSQGLDEFLARGAQFEYLHVDDNFLRLAQMIDLIPSEHPFVYIQQIIFVLVRPVPRVFWPEKPVSAGFELPTALGMEGVSLSTSIIGEWYLAFGWLAVVIGGWLHGRLAAWTSALRRDAAVGSNPIIYALAVMVLVSGIRSMQDLVLMSYAILAWVGVSWLLTRGRRRIFAAQ